MAFLEAVSVEGVKRCQTGASPTSSTIASSASSSSIASTALTSTTSSEPLVVEADSSNLPLDADLLNEIETGMSSDVLHFTTQPVVNVGIEEQQFQQNLTPACSVTQWHASTYGSVCIVAILINFVSDYPQNNIVTTVRLWEALGCRLALYWLTHSPSQSRLFRSCLP